MAERASEGVVYSIRAKPRWVDEVVVVVVGSVECGSVEVLLVVVVVVVGSWMEAISPKGRKACVRMGRVMVGSRPPGGRVSWCVE